jgi:beta-RFAP synthase
MTKIVEVRTGARLHFGLFATTSSDGSLGGIGMMIDRPGFVIQAWRSTQDQIFAPRDLVARIEGFVSRVRADLQTPSVGVNVEEPAAPVAIRVLTEIPPHRGFGSGTQLAYAIASAMARVLDVWPSFRPDSQLGRGSRSMVGTLGFDEGGFIADLSQSATDIQSRFIRRDVAAHWRFVVIDPLGSAGPAGAAEAAGFASLSPMPRSSTERLLTILREHIVPGLDNVDFAAFAGGVADFNRVVGEHFAPAQGGVYAHPVIRELAARLVRTEWPSIAQSSWGPAAVVPCACETSAERLTAFLGDCLQPKTAKVFVATPRNRGTSVRRLIRRPKFKGFS